MLIPVPILTRSFLLFSQKLSTLCDSCNLEAAKTTLERQDVIYTLRQAGREFCYTLDANIITQDMRQRIKKTVTDAEALGQIRDVC